MSTYIFSFSAVCTISVIAGVASGTNVAAASATSGAGFNWLDSCGALCIRAGVGHAAAALAVLYWVVRYFVIDQCNVQDKDKVQHN